MLAVASCGRHEPDYGSDANELRAYNRVPQSIRLAAAELLRRCDMPVKGHTVYFYWEGQSPNHTPYTLQLIHSEFEERHALTCLNAQITSLGLTNEIDIGEEPSAPPPEPKGHS